MFTVEHFEGCLLGQALGDALGAPFEGLSAETIYRDFGGAESLVTKPPLDKLVYTDDTEMMISIAQCLVDKGAIDGDNLADRFVQNYSPLRGYGPGARRILDAMKSGGDWRHMVQTVFPGGSLGNGAAMRVAPIGLYFHDDLHRVAFEAEASARVTHVHPIGIDGAVIFASAVALVIRSAGQVFNPTAFFTELASRARTEEFQWQLKTAAQLDPHVPINFGNSLEAHRSVTTALLCFTFNPNSFLRTILAAIRMGNDTDTLAAMAGALSGAYLGCSALPAISLNMLENGDRGRDHIRQLAKSLFQQRQR